MTGNLLDKYRQAAKDETASKVEMAAIEGQPYKAFEIAATPQRRIDLRTGYDASRIVSYAYLSDIIHAGGMCVALVFTSPYLTVDMRGVNLQELVDMLREERVVFIEEHVAEWHSPPQKGQPYVESMVLVEPGKRSKRPPGRH
jgi:hypothetical protein